MDGLILKGDGRGRGRGRSRDALKIEVIDDTALIDIAAYSSADNKKPETGGKKDKVPRRRGKTLNKFESVFPHTHTHMVESAEKNGPKRVYSRKEMEALRFVNVEQQKNKWNEIYNGLGLAVAREYDGMLEFNHNHNHLRVDFDPRHNFRKRTAAPAFLGEESSGKMDNEIESMNSLDLACGLSVSDVVDEECSQDDDSDAEFSRIQRPAFLVTGVPDFDSGPPQDGLEYLRRVRWEAERIPKVKVAKVERSKLNKEQTIYMPKIPDIAKCSQHLMPLKQWEDTFLADFSELRLTFSRHAGDCAKISDVAHSVSIVHPEECYHGILEKIENLTVDSLSTENENENEDSSSSLSSAVSFVNRPTLSTILGMDSVARVSMLRKRINSVETVSSLSRNDCEWLFALCAAVDTPLNADTCAALRCLLRKCASLRAEKLELDDEVVMLNILATISGKYFGQSES